MFLTATRTTTLHASYFILNYIFKNCVKLHLKNIKSTCLQLQLKLVVAIAKCQRARRLSKKLVENLS